MDRYFSRELPESVMDAAETNNDGTLRCKPSPNFGEGTASMQKFVMQHMTSILHPMSQHVKELQEYTEELAKDLKLVGSKVEENRSKLDNHSVMLSKGHEELRSKAGELEGLREEYQNLHDKQIIIESDTKSVKEAVGTMEERLSKSIDVQHVLHKSMDDTKSEMHELGLKLWKTSALAEKIQAGLSELTESHTGLHERHLGLARSSQQVTKICEGTQNGLAKLTPKFEHHRKEMSNGIASLNERSTCLEKMLLDVRNQLGSYDQQAASTRGIIEAMQTSLGGVQCEVGKLTGGQGKDNKNKKEDSIIARLQAAEQGLDKISQNVEYVTTSVLGTVHNLKRDLDDSTVIIASHQSNILELSSKAERHGNEILSTKSRTDELELKEATLSKRANDVDDSVSQLVAFQRSSARQLDLHTLELERAQVDRHQMGKKIEGVAESVHSVSTDLGATNDGVARISSRLDLAHEYFDGLNKGLQETHKQVLTGQSGMLPPKGPHTPRLPALHMSPPRTHTKMKV